MYVPRLLASAIWSAGSHTRLMVYSHQGLVDTVLCQSLVTSVVSFIIRCFEDMFLVPYRDPCTASFLSCLHSLQKYSDTGSKSVLLYGWLRMIIECSWHQDKKLRLCSQTSNANQTGNSTVGVQSSGTAVPDVSICAILCVSGFFGCSPMRSQIQYRICSQCIAKTSKLEVARASHLELKVAVAHCFKNWHDE